MSVSCGPNSSDIFTFSGMLVLPIRSKRVPRRRAAARDASLQRSRFAPEAQSRHPEARFGRPGIRRFHWDNGYPPWLSSQTLRNLFETKPTPETAARTPIFFAPM